MCLLDPWRVFALLRLRLRRRQLSGVQLCFKPGLVPGQIVLLLKMGADLHGQRAELRIQLGQAGKRVALRRQLFEQMQGLALISLAVP